MENNVGSTEVKPSFTWRYILLSFLLIVITNTTTIYITEFLKEDNIINTFTSSSQNLAIMPDTAAEKLEIFLSVSPTQKELIKSLFRYEITIKNNSSEGIDDFTAIFDIPSSVKLVPKPEISSNPPDLMKVIKINEVPTQIQQRVYGINLLNKGEEITFSYLGYSENLVPVQPLKVIIHKKNWSQNDVERISELDIDKGYYELIQYIILVVQLIAVVLLVIVTMMATKDVNTIRNHMNVIVKTVDDINRDSVTIKSHLEEQQRYLNEQLRNLRT